MSFPQNPTTGQIAVVDGIQYQYNTTNNRWLRVAAYVTATTNLTVTSPTNATSPTTGALVVQGGAGVGSDLYVAGNEYLSGNLNITSGAASTGTGASNSLYTQGGAYITKTLYVGGTTLFGGNVVFQNTATFVASTNTYYTSALLELHTPPGGVGDHWTLDDGNDIGFRFHYYNRAKSADENAALVLADGTQRLTWYGTGASNTATDNFSTATYGTFQTGQLILSSGHPNTGNTTTGDLQVLGGVGIGQNLFVADTLMVGAATSITGYLSVASAISTYTGVVNISGNADNSRQAPQNLGVMLQLTGQVEAPSRVYNDGQGTGNYAAYIGRHYNGTTASPTELNNNDIIARFGGTSYNTSGWTPISNARMDFVADEHQLGTAQGTRAELWITPTGTTTSNITKMLSIATSGTYIYSTTTVITSTATNALQVAGGIVASSLCIGGSKLSTSTTIEVNGTVIGNATTLNFGTGTTATVVNGVANIFAVASVPTLQSVTDGGSTTTDAITVSNLLTANSISVVDNVEVGGTLVISGGSVVVTIISYNGVCFQSKEVTGFVGGEGLIPQSSGLGLSSGITYYVTGVFGPTKFVLSTTTNGVGVGTVGTGNIPSTAGYAPGLRVENVANFNSTATSTSTTTGAVIVTGGVGIGGCVNIGGTAVINSAGVTNNLQVGGAVTVLGNSSGLSIIGYNGVSFQSNSTTNFIGGEAVTPASSGLGLTANTTYYVIAVLSATRFLLSATPNGTGVGSVGTANISLTVPNAVSLKVANGSAHITTTTDSVSTTTGALIVNGGAGIGGNLNVGGAITAASIVAGGVRTTSSSTAPTSPVPVVGDIWYNTNNDAIYRYTNDGVNSFWIDITGPVVKTTVVP